MNTLKPIFILFILFLLFACGNTKSSADYEISNAANEAQNAAPEYKEQNSLETNRKLIKTGRVSFETSDMKSTKEQIVNAAQEYNAYISSDQETNSNGYLRNTLEIRVPSKNFDQFLANATKGVSTFDEKQIVVEDVTAKFIDIEARLTTKKALEERYRAILTRANSVTEILEIEREIATIREEIESAQGQLDYLKDQVSFSTLTIEFYKNLPIKKQKKYNFLNGFQKGWDNLVWFTLQLVKIWPFILLSFALVYAINHLRRKRRRNKLQ